MNLPLGSGGAGDGSDTQFGAFYREQFARVAGFLIMLGASWDEALDSTQEAFIELLVRWHTPGFLEKIDSLEAYVRKVAQNRFFRRNARELTGKEVELRIFLEQNRDNLPAVNVPFIQEQVMEIITQLPPSQRLVVAWFLDGFELHEIATALGKPETTVRSNFRHARRRLKHELSKIGIAVKAVSEAEAE